MHLHIDLVNKKPHRSGAYKIIYDLLELDQSRISHSVAIPDSFLKGSWIQTTCRSSCSTNFLPFSS